MKRIVILVILPLFLIGCTSWDELERENRAREKKREENQERAQLICINRGGVPVLNSYGRMESCTFKTGSKNVKIEINQ